VPNADELIGRTIAGRFQILGKLGQGGMGCVYRARQLSFDREVALKVLDRKHEHDPIAAKRFLREAQLASTLTHPNTVSVLALGRDDDAGVTFLVMELVRGRTLREVLAEAGALPAARIARIGVQLIDALEAAHALSIVHRDLKPENVMLLDAPGSRDLVKVLDFGLARSFVDPVSRATETGTIAGTPRYLPPEAFEGAEPAPAQDLYALGAVLGELALGRALWDAPTLASLVAQKLSDTLPELTGVTPALRTLVAELLAPQPAARPAHAAVRTRLLAIGDGAPAGPTPVAEAVAPAPIELDPEWERERAQRAARAAPAARARRPRGVRIALAMLLAGGAVAGAIVLMRSPHSQAPTTVTLSIATRAPATIAVDGRTVGTSPVQIALPRGEHAVMVSATIGGKAITRAVVPDQDRAIVLP
jgi:serine/threonine-protein kinase